MDKIIRTTKQGILISDQELNLPNLILKFENYRHTTPTVDNYANYVHEVDDFQFSESFKQSCGNENVCDVLLDHTNDDGRYRYRNYSNNIGIAFLYRHPRYSLRSIVNAAEMYDKPVLYWYLID